MLLDISDFAQTLERPLLEMHGYTLQHGDQFQDVMGKIENREVVKSIFGMVYYWQWFLRALIASIDLVFVSCFAHFALSLPSAYHLSTPTFIQDVFGGQIITTIRCKTCRSVSFQRTL